MKFLEENISNKSLIRFLILIIAFATFSFLVTIIFYISNFNNGLSSDQSVWGTFGDFLGGTLNPILSFLSLLALLFTIVLQNKELQETRKELRQSREAQEEQTKSFQAQLKLLEQKEKRDLTFQILERWTSSTMRTHRLNAWNYLEDKFEGRSITLNLDEFRDNNIDSFESFTEVCQFFSDLNKILSENLLDKELAMILFNDSVYPWFRYTDKIVFNNLDSESKKMNYTKRVRNWYRTKVITLKQHFDELKIK
jgi:uncharacterized membrane protein